MSIGKKILKQFNDKGIIQNNKWDNNIRKQYTTNVRINISGILHYGFIPEPSGFVKRDTKEEAMRNVVVALKQLGVCKADISELIKENL